MDRQEIEVAAASRPIERLRQLLDLARIAEQAEGAVPRKDRSRQTIEIVRPDQVHAGPSVGNVVAILVVLHHPVGDQVELDGADVAAARLAAHAAHLAEEVAALVGDERDAGGADAVRVGEAPRRIAAVDGRAVVGKVVRARRPAVIGERQQAGVGDVGLIRPSRRRRQQPACVVAVDIVAVGGHAEGAIVADRLRGDDAVAHRHGAAGGIEARAVADPGAPIGVVGDGDVAEAEGAGIGNPGAHAEDPRLDQIAAHRRAGERGDAGIVQSGPESGA